jgi:hypothetical protein
MRRRSPWPIVMLALCAGLIILSACGRKTAVKPPELVAPEAISNLAAINAADGVALTWARPTKYADGARMADLGAFRVERRTESTPFASLATIEVTDRERIQQERRFRWLDVDTTVGEIYEYRVISSTTDGYVSQPSNVVTIVRSLPTPAPRPTATARAR